MVLMTLALTGRLRAAEEKALAASRQAEQRAVELAGEMTRELVEKQRELEEALATERQALETQVRFVEMVSHEYRTPLAIIRANLDILEMKGCKAECVLFPNLGKMRRAVARLVEVLEVSLGRERLDNPQRRMSQETIPLAPFLRSLLEEAGALWGERRLEFDLQATNRATVAGDPSLLKTAFLNLLDNALKYSAEADPVCVSVRAAAAEVVVMVRDCGRGIAPEELGRVFEKYYRGTGSADTRGAGLGLYLVRRIIEQHDGSITLDSPETGGTVATIRLPLA
jgi:signal transduction histidine kinase